MRRFYFKHTLRNQIIQGDITFWTFGCLINFLTEQDLLDTSDVLDTEVMNIGWYRAAFRKIADPAYNYFDFDLYEISTDLDSYFNDIDSALGAESFINDADDAYVAAIDARMASDAARVDANVAYDEVDTDDD